MQGKPKGKRDAKRGCAHRCYGCGRQKALAERAFLPAAEDVVEPLLLVPHEAAAILQVKDAMLG
jgi:hypothetical protein